MRRRREATPASRLGARDGGRPPDGMSLFDRKPTSRERTQEDRERARAEREARRAAREGRAPAGRDPTIAPPAPFGIEDAPAPAPAPVSAPAPAPTPAPAPPPRREERELQPAAAAPTRPSAARPSFIDHPVREDWSVLAE